MAHAIDGCLSPTRRCEIALVTRANQDKGEAGERLAEDWLVAHGYSVIERRFRSGHRDIDLIVAQEDPEGGRMVAFVEVKARSSADYGGPLGAINWRKQRELRRSAQVWIDRNMRLRDNYRFDVVAVTGGQVEHVANAFMVR